MTSIAMVIFGVEFFYSPYLLGGGFCLLILSVILKGRILVGQSQAVIVERSKKFHKVCYSGVNFINPFWDTLRVIHPYQSGMDRYFLEMREKVLETPDQSVITEDNVSLTVGTLFFFQVIDPKKAVYEIDNLEKAIQFLTISALRNIIGELSFDKTLTSRDQINKQLQEALNEASTKWGIRVLRVELKDIKARDEIQNAMQKQMQAERSKRAWVLEAEGQKNAEILKAEGERQAAIIRAEGESQARLIQAKAQAEVKKIEILSEAERIALIHQAMEKNPPPWELIVLRYFESLEKMAQGQATKIFLPFESQGIIRKELLKNMFNIETASPEKMRPSVFKEEIQAELDTPDIEES
jgi:regulator of protease activity HflC (stomatin/prohibitin superfamily)